MAYFSYDLLPFTQAPYDLEAARLFRSQLEQLQALPSTQWVVPVIVEPVHRISSENRLLYDAHRDGDLFYNLVFLPHIADLNKTSLGNPAMRLGELIQSDQHRCAVSISYPLAKKLGLGLRDVVTVESETLMPHAGLSCTISAIEIVNGLDWIFVGGYFDDDREYYSPVYVATTNPQEALALLRKTNPHDEYRLRTDIVQMRALENQIQEQAAARGRRVTWPLNLLVYTALLMTVLWRNYAVRRRPFAIFYALGMPAEPMIGLSLAEALFFFLISTTAGSLVSTFIINNGLLIYVSPQVLLTTMGLFLVPLIGIMGVVCVLLLRKYRRTPLAWLLTEE